MVRRPPESIKARAMQYCRMVGFFGDTTAQLQTQARLSKANAAGRTRAHDQCGWSPPPARSVYRIQLSADRAPVHVAGIKLDGGPLGANFKFDFTDRDSDGLRVSTFR